MGMAWTKRLAASVAISLLALAPAAHAQQSGDTDGSGYLAQHFSFDALNPDVKEAIARANLAPVPFQKIVIHTRDVMTSPDQPQPSTYSSAMTLENAGHGLVRRVTVMQDSSGAATGTRLDLTYRGYFSLLTQGISTRATSVPPVQETRKLLRFDTGTHGHVAIVYLYGATGGPTFQDPGQFLCDSGKSYSAAQLNPSIEGQALELNCRVIDTNGIETDKVTLAYLENYGVAVTLRTHNEQRTVNSSILDFSAH
jgi:hypothetical protein